MPPLPPGPTGSLLTGCLSEFRRDRLAFVTRCVREYGDVVPYRLALRRFLLFNHPDQVQEILLNHDGHFIKPKALLRNRLLFGRGILVAEGDEWRKQHKLIGPAFGHKAVASYAPGMLTCVDQLLGRWRDGQEADLAEEMTGLTLAIVGKVLFGTDIDAGEAGRIGGAMRAVTEFTVARVNSAVIIPEWVPTPVNLRLRRAIRELGQILDDILRERRQSTTTHCDVLDRLLAAYQAIGHEDDHLLRDQMVTLFLAGHETTATALAWAWYLLAMNPRAEAELHREVDGALGGGRLPTADDIEAMPYTRGVFAEAMRLYPPVWLIGREAVRDCEVGGFPVARGTTVLVSPWLIQRDPRWYADPGEFRPERWTDEFTDGLPRGAYVPFSGGPRVCVGMHFAKVEAALILAAVASRYRFELLPEPRVQPHPVITLRLRHGLPVRFRARR
jgi:cytochrome P450